MIAAELGPAAEITHLRTDSAFAGPVAAGAPAPLGATFINGGVNFSLFSRTATGVTLELFNGTEDAVASRSITLDPIANRTYHYWHIFVPNLKSGQIYGFRVAGPADPENGLRFDVEKLLLDPYGRGIVTPSRYSRSNVNLPGDNAANAMKSVLVDGTAYDWEGDTPLRLPSSRLAIYELHVRGFTRNPNSGVDEQRRGTYAGLIEKIPYLQELGVNAVELLPVFAFDPYDAPPGRRNYWGYAPVSFFAPHPAYCSSPDPLAPVREFRDMVKALHRAGIEVILDVVFNHTAEGSELGPTICFRGIDNPSYYILESNRQYYSNFTGCGNTLNANHPIVRRMIVDSLRYWVTEMHVDGFRFDLASILSRDSAGQLLPNPPVLWDIESDPELAGTKLIAEAWDAAGLYQVGSFIGDTWKEWNGKFRDDVRDFWRGVAGSIGRMADRMLGSHDVYGHKRREAEQSVNYVTCHDGFTLNDLVSYNEKHNEENGENNRDGADDNRSWNCGAEGPANDAMIESLRVRQIKNFFTVTILSLGVPMFVMGDEVRRTQRGNNNAYCHDDELSWFDWSLVEAHSELFRFVQHLLKRRVARNLEHEQRRTSLSEMLHRANVFWHGPRLLQPDWTPESHAFAFTAELQHERKRLHVIVNGDWRPLTFELPPTPEDLGWRRWIDTALPSPQDIVAWEMATPLSASTYDAEPRSMVLLLAEESSSRTGSES